MTRPRPQLAISLFVMLALAVGVAPSPTPAPPSVEVGARRALLGRSVQDRPIRLRILGERGAAHSVLVVGCIHGNECAGKAVIDALKRLPPRDDLTVFLVRDLNPDGSRARTRQNARGVDLNRNFARGWRSYGEPWDTYYPGPEPFSEPETRIARELVIDRRPKVTIWYHQHMSLVTKQRSHERVQRRYARLVGLPLRRLDPLPGTASRWQNHRFPRHTSFVVELPAGSLSPRAARRHARAVLEVGLML